MKTRLRLAGLALALAQDLLDEEARETDKPLSGIVEAADHIEAAWESLRRAQDEDA